MDDKNGKEKLQQELNFLKESFDADVISKDEYEKGKERVEQKLKEINNHVNDKENEPGDKTETQEQKSEDFFEAKQSKLTGKEEPKQEEKKEKYLDNQIKDNKKDSKLFMYTIVFVVLALVVFFVYSLINTGKSPSQTTQTNIKTNSVALCSSDKDCMKDNVAYVCIDPGTKDAKCQAPEIPKTKVTVLNGRKECFNCDTQRILSLLESWFGAIDSKEVDYNSKEGKSLADKYSVNILPAYILEEKITNSTSFEQLRQIFIKRSDAYTLKEDAAGATFYFRRENISNKIDLFVKENDAASAKAEKNLQEFLDTFKNVQFEKHIQGDNLTSELNIRTFPTFLINNQIKFSGVQTADVIKNNYCNMNKDDECKKNLSRNLV